MNRFLFSALVYLLVTTSPALAQPVVDLGPNVSVCDNLLLNAGNPGASYLWNNGATTGSILVSSSGTYWVQVTDGGLTASDTIEVTVAQTPALPVAQLDTTVCGIGGHVLAPPHYADLYRWYGAPVGGLAFHSNDTLFSNLTSDTLFYLEPANTGFVGSIGEGDGAVNNYNAAPRGTYFDVFETLVINGVYMIAQNNPTFTIELRNPANVVVQSRNVALGPGGTTYVPLDFTVPPGLGYQLRVTGITGGTLGRISTGITYPYVLPGKISLTGVYNSPATSFNYLFNWSVSSPYCSGPRIPYSISVRPAPAVNLGADTLLCGGFLTLDATNNFPNVHYVWSTGDTIPSIDIYSTQVVEVTVSVGGCSVVDTIDVQIAQNAFAPLVPSFLPVCGGDSTLIESFGGSGAVVWYDAALGGNIIGYGDTLRAFFLDSTMVYAQTLTNGNVLPAGPPDNTFAGGTYATLNNRGGVFDVLEPAVLHSVKVYAQGAPSFTIDLKDNTGQVIYTKNFTLTAGLQLLTLEWPLSPGTDYRLIGKTITGGQLYLNTSGAAYPYANALLAITGSTTVSTYYEYFYDWRVGNQDVCISTRSPCAVNIIPQPVPGALPDSAFCGLNAFDLNAGNPGAAYLWSTGATTQQINVSQNGQYTVSITNGGICTRVDTAEVRFFDAPNQPLAQAVSVCEPGQMALLPSNDFLLWYDTPLGENAFLAGTSFNANILNDTVFYVEAAARNYANIGVANHINPAGGNFLGFPIAMIFDAPTAFTLDSVAVYASNAPTSFTVQLRNASGEVLASRPVTVLGAGQKTYIPLDFQVPMGLGHRLQFVNLTGGGLATSPAIFPITNDHIGIVGNSIGTPENYYFYDWHYSFGLRSCRSQRVPISIDVRLPLQLPDSVYVCEELLLNVDLPGADFSWSTGETSAAILVATAGHYAITATEQGGTCTATDDIEVAFPAPIGLPQDGVLCDSLLQTHYAFPAQFLWSTGETSDSIFIQNMGPYAVTVTEPNGCTLTDSILVSGLGEAPAWVLPSDVIGCEMVVLSAGNVGASYLWSTGETSENITVGVPGSYAVTVASADGCTVAGAVAVAVDQPPVANFTYAIVGNGLRYEFDNQSSAGQYFWDFGFITSTAEEPIVIFPAPGNYIVTLVVSNACGSDTMVVNFLADFIGVEQLSAIQNINIFPNPVAGELFLDFSLSENRPHKATLYNALGSKQLTLDLSGQEALVRMDLENFSVGMYGLLLEWEDGKKGYAKVVKF